MIVSRSAVHYALSNDETWWIDVAMYSHVPIAATWIDKDNRLGLIRADNITAWQKNAPIFLRREVPLLAPGRHHTTAVA